jgi:hypothetical protein
MRSISWWRISGDADPRRHGDAWEGRTTTVTNTFDWAYYSGAPPSRAGAGLPRLLNQRIDGHRAGRGRDGLRRGWAGLGSACRRAGVE